MCTLLPGHVIQGAHWSYRIAATIQGDQTHNSTVFKAEVIKRNESDSTPRWAVIKRVSPDDGVGERSLVRELACYELPGVDSADCFRQMYDKIDERTVALEYLETTLGSVKYKPDRDTSNLIKSVMTAALTSCDVLEKQDHVNTDFKPTNVLLSGIGSQRVTAKVGDLGLVYPARAGTHGQPYAMRAPEVFIGQPVAAPSAIWAVAAMVICWINPRILGILDCPHWLINDAWCMAKLKRLFPKWEIPSPDTAETHTLHSTFEAAPTFAQEVPDILLIQPLDEELRKMQISAQLCALLQSMLVIEAVERPTASAVLASDEFREFSAS